MCVLWMLNNSFKGRLNETHVITNKKRGYIFTDLVVKGRACLSVFRAKLPFEAVRNARFLSILITVISLCIEGADLLTWWNIQL